MGLFQEKLLAVCDTMAPYGYIQIRGALPTWMTNEYLLCADARDTAKKVSNSSKNPVDYFRYKQIRHEANTLCCNLEGDYISSSIEENKDNVKKLWRILRKLIPSYKGTRDEECVINGLTDTLCIAESFNKMFCSIGYSLADKIPDVDERLLPDLLDCDSEFIFERVDTSAVAEILKNISSAKATGIDGINAKFLKLAYNLLSGPT